MHKTKRKIHWPSYTKQFQKEGVRRINYFKGVALLADEMRLGKTLQTLLYCSAYMERSPVVIVCPATVKHVWQHQILEHLNMRSLLIEGGKPFRTRQILATRPHFIILNYDILRQHLKYLMSLHPQILIIDECHYIKNRKAQRTKNCKKLSRKIPHRIAISGTPLTNRPSELFPTLNILHPKKFRSFWKFAFRYCGPRHGTWGWEYKGASHIAELHKMLTETMMIRRLRKDVMKYYKEPLREIIPMDISNPKEYQEAENNFIVWLQKKSIKKAKSAQKAKRLVQMGYLARLAAELKMKSVFQWIDDFLESSDEKLLLCGVHQKIINQLHERYKKISVVVNGKVVGKKRAIAIKSFQTNKKIRIFIGNIQAAGVGIDLSKANTIAFVELDWVPGNHTQFEDRIININKKSQVTIYYFVGYKTIEHSRCKILQRKQKVLSATLNGNVTDNQLNIYDELEKSLLKKVKN